MQHSTLNTRISVSLSSRSRTKTIFRALLVEPSRVSPIIFPEEKEVTLALMLSGGRNEERKKKRLCRDLHCFDHIHCSPYRCCVNLSLLLEYGEVSRQGELPRMTMSTAQDPLGTITALIMME